VKGVVTTGRLGASVLCVPAWRRRMLRVCRSPGQRHVHYRGESDESEVNSRSRAPSGFNV
jgi:hypothetical protein